MLLLCLLRANQLKRIMNHKGILLHRHRASYKEPPGGQGVGVLKACTRTCGTDHEVLWRETVIASYNLYLLALYLQLARKIAHL